MRPDPTAVYRQAPLAELLTILLRQFKRPLLSQGITLSDAEAAAIAEQIDARAPLSEKAIAVRDALIKLIIESEGVLAAWGLTFAQSLDADMSDIPGWESTADFLELANAKANAELRISTGAALVTALGDGRFRHHLGALIQRAQPDLDTVIAERVLALDNHQQ